MKRTLTRVGRRLLSVLLALCLTLSMVGTAFATETSNESADETNHINYVSLGDSMTNGYGFTGYNQTSKHTSDYNFMTGKGMYGDGAYPLLFEQYLKDQGYDVTHTKLATSAMTAEDLLYLLGGRDYFEDGWAGYRDYVGGYSDDEIKRHMQNAVANADIITMCIGNASFGAYLVEKISSALGVFGSELNEVEKVDFEDAIAVLDFDAEQKELVMGVYNELVAQLITAVPAELVDEYNLEQIVDLISYTAASYVVNYKLLVEQILEMNPDVEIILVGLMNTTYGMNITDDNGNVLVPFGDVMDSLFSVLNAYMAGLPAVLQAQGVAPEAKLYYAEQPNPEFICQQFDDLLANGWKDIGSLSAATVRQRNLDAYNYNLRDKISEGLKSQLPEITQLPEINMGDVQNYEEIDWDGYDGNPWGAFGNETGKLLSVAIYLALEEAVAKSTDTMNIPLTSLVKITGDLSSVFRDLGTPPDRSPEASREWLLKGLTGTPVLKGMCKIYGLFKVGNGMSVHPTPDCHADIAKAVEEAYETKHTVQDETLDNLTEAAILVKDLVVEYYDEAYAYAYVKADEAGYIDAAKDGIDAVIAELEKIDLSGTEMTDAFQAEVKGEIEEIIETLKAAQALIKEADVLDQATLDALIATLDEAGESIENLKNLLAQAGADVNDLVVVPALEAAYDKLVNEVIPEATEKLQAAIEDGTEWLMAKAQEAYEALVEAAVAAAKEYAPEVADWIYNWLYNNPDKVIAFFNEYGDDMIAFLNEHQEEILAVLGYVLVNYGDEIAQLVMDNADVILKTMVDWVDEHGENAWALICVYLEELGVCDAVEKGVQGIMDELTALLGQVDAELAAKLESVIAELEAAIEDLLAEAESAKDELNQKLADLKDQLADLEQQLAEKKAELENAVGEAKAELEAAIAELEAKIAEVQAAIEALENQLAALADEIEALYNAVLGLEDAVNTLIEEGLNAGMAAIQSALDDVADAVVDLAAAISEEAAAKLAEAIEDVKDMLNEVYIDATTDNYVITEDSYYVALGDAAAYGDAANKLTQALGLCSSHANLTVDGQTADALLADIDGYAAEIAKADLITLGFGANAFTDYAASQAALVMNNSAADEKDWTKYVGQEGAADIAEKLAELKASFQEAGLGVVLGMDLAEAMTVAVESYAYSYVKHVVAYAQLVNAIHEINPDAQVVLVGMYNPMEGIVVALGEDQIDLGAYLQYLVDLSNAYALGYAMIVPETIYVDAPDVAVTAQAGTYTIYQLLGIPTGDSILKNTDAYDPTDAGYEYIKDQILNAINPSFVATGLLGDVNNDGLVDVEDAMLILQYEAELIDGSEINMCVSDVNADGFTDVEDAMYILQLEAELIDKLPADK